MRAAVCAALLLSLACIRETPDVSQSQPSESTTLAGTAGAETNTVNPPIPQQRDTPTSRVTPATTPQEVHLIEYAIHMPQTMRAGKVVFNVENGGQRDHGFEIEGQGIEEKTQVLKRGESAALPVELKPGTYTVYCPVKGHAARGMKLTITVQ